MTEVLKALQELNVCWKKIGHYNMKCRWLPGFPGHPESMLNSPMHHSHSFGDESAIVESDDVAGKSSNVVKFEVQVCLLVFSLIDHFFFFQKEIFNSVKLVIYAITY